MTHLARAGSLFLFYAGVGWLGDQGMGLLGRGLDGRDEPVTRAIRQIEPAIGVDVRVRSSGECAFEALHELSIDVADAALLDIDVGAGSLVVEGREGVGEVTVVGLGCASSGEALDALSFVGERVGRRVVVSAGDPEGRGWFGRGTDARLNLVVTMPLGMSVEIDDSSGSMIVTGSGDLRVRDSSGSIAVRGVLGTVWIDDSSGSIEVTGTSGDIEISDGSGSIEVRGAGGSVLLRDGSGSIDVAGVAGDALVESDGSGGIFVRQVGGDFVVARDGSGDVRYEAVAGKVDVPGRGQMRRDDD